MKTAPATARAVHDVSRHPSSMSEDITVVREGGVEPPCPFGHTDLNRARLPIPPLALSPPGWAAG
jgi:hypothetical protein